MKNGRHFKVPKLKCVKGLVTQSCLTLCDPMDCSLPSSSVHGILQARILESVAIPFSRGSCRRRYRTWDSCFAGRFFTIWATSSVQSLSHVRLFVTPWLQHARPSCPSPTPEACPNSCPSRQWCHPTISFSVMPFSSYLQSFLASVSFPTNQFFASGGQSFGVSASASVLPTNIQDWCPLGWTGWISLQSKGLSRVFSNTTVQKHQFFGAQLSLWSNSHIHTQLLEKP